MPRASGPSATRTVAVSAAALPEAGDRYGGGRYLNFVEDPSAPLVHQLDGGERDRAVAGLVRQVVHHRAEVLEVVSRQSLSNRGDGRLDLPGPEVGDARHRPHVDRLPGQLLDVLEEAPLPGLGQGDGDALPPSSTHAPDAVDVAFGGGRNLVVEDVAQGVDVESTRGHVGGDQQFGGPVAEPRHDAIALGLVHTAVQSLRSVAPGCHFFGQLVHFGPGPTEDQRRVRRLDVEDPAESRWFVTPLDEVDGLAGQGGLKDSASAADLHPFGIALIPLRERVNTGRKGGRKQDRLTRGGGGLENLLDVLSEAHVEHLVGLVENHGADGVENE